MRLPLFEDLEVTLKSRPQTALEADYEAASSVASVTSEIGNEFTLNGGLRGQFEIAASNRACVVKGLV